MRGRGGGKAEAREVPRLEGSSGEIGRGGGMEQLSPEVSGLERRYGTGGGLVVGSSPHSRMRFLITS